MPQPPQQHGIEMVGAHANDFDNAVQFLHIHIYNILFKEPI